MKGKEMLSVPFILPSRTMEMEELLEWYFDAGATTWLIKNRDLFKNIL